jgi:hypothetical protein
VESVADFAWNRWQTSTGIRNHFLSSPKVQNYIINLSSRAAGQSGLNKATIEPYPVYLPSIAEQKRIVAILDEAFEGIGQAVANAEKNLTNARELFESFLSDKLLPIASKDPTQTLSCLTCRVPRYLGLASRLGWDSQLAESTGVSSIVFSHLSHAVSGASVRGAG